MILDGWASEPQYLDHLAPVWAALPEELRGTLWVVGGLQPLPGLPGVRVGRTRPRGPDPVLVASWGDIQGVRPAPVVLVEHGVGQSYQDAENGCYSGGAGRERAVLFIVPNHRAAERNLARYPDIPNAVVGCPKLDAYHRRQTSPLSGGGPSRPAGSEQSGAPPGYGQDLRLDGARLGQVGQGLVGSGTARRGEPSRLCVSFHWDDAGGPPERHNALAYYQAVLPEVARAFPGALGHCHPRAWHSIAGVLGRAGFDLVRDFDEVMERADVYVCDNSSTLWEFASLDKPVVVLNAPEYRRGETFWPRFWDAIPGLQCDEPDHLVERIHEALADTEAMRISRKRAVAEVYAHVDGRASERAAEAIVRRLAELEEETPVVTPADRDDGYTPVPRPPDALAPAWPPLPRLRACGMTEDEVGVAVQQWQTWSETERWEATDHMNSLTDSELAELIEEGRAASAPDGGVPEGTVAELRAWIGDDARRARLVFDAEIARPHVRSGVTEYANEILATHPPDEAW